MAKVKDITCEEMKCELCPFIQAKYLKNCTSFKRSETIGQGFQKSKNRLFENERKNLEIRLEQEYTG